MAQTKQLSLDTLVQQVDGVIGSPIDQQLILASLKSDKFYGMDLISSEIWEILATPSTVRDICNQLVQEYETDSENCQRDVLAFVQKLLNAQLVAVVSA